MYTSTPNCFVIYYLLITKTDNKKKKKIKKKRQHENPVFRQRTGSWKKLHPC